MALTWGWMLALLAVLGGIGWSTYRWGLRYGQAQERSQWQQTLAEHERAWHTEHADAHEKRALAEQALAMAQQQLSERSAQVAQAQQELTALHQQVARQTALLQETQALEDRFKVLSTAIAQQQSATWLTQTAQERETHRQVLDQLLKPLQELIQKNAQSVELVQKDSVEVRLQMTQAFQRVMSQTELLNNTNTHLAQALSNNKGRGDWGELALIRVLEASGLIEGIHYETQLSERDTASGALQRPDVTIKLPNDRVLYIDAKAIFVNLERLTQIDDALSVSAMASDEAQREALLRERKEHAQALRRQIQQLSVKQYESLSNKALEFVVLYLPRESMLRVALEELPELMEEALRNRVMLAGPLNLLPLLKSVGAMWRQWEANQNALAIQAVAEDIHQKLVGFFEAFTKAEDQLEKAHQSLAQVRHTFSNRQGLLTQFKKLERLGVQSKKTLPKAMAALATVDEPDDTLGLEDADVLTPGDMALSAPL